MGHGHRGPLAPEANGTRGSGVGVKIEDAKSWY